MATVTQLPVNTIDMEVYNGHAGPRMVYQTAAGIVYEGLIDPDTGLFLDDGQETAIATGVAALTVTKNGPEYGVDGDSVHVFFTKLNTTPDPDTYQIYRWTGATTLPLWSDTTRRQSALASKNRLQLGIRIAYLQGDLTNGGTWYYTTLNPNPGTETSVTTQPSGNVLGYGPRWIDDTYELIYVKESDDNIYKFDTTDDSETQLTNDGATIEKKFAYGWHDPVSNEQRVLCMAEGETEIRIYAPGSPYWTLLYTITPPATTSFDYFGSPEPFINKDKSYISCTLKSAVGQGETGTGEPWIFSMDGTESYRGSTAAVKAVDPEPLVLRHKVYQYYYVAPTYTGWVSATDLEPLRSIEFQARTQLREVPARLLYNPSASGPMEIILFDHGASGNNAMYDPLLEYWAANDYAVMSVDHKDVGDRHSPAADQYFEDWDQRPLDTRAAFDMLPELADQFGLSLNFNRIGVCGHSFGAYTASNLAGTIGHYNGVQVFGLDIDPDALIYLSGPGTDSTQLDDTVYSPWGRLTCPLMVLTGTNDPTRLGGSWTLRKDIYNEAPVVSAGTSEQIARGGGTRHLMVVTDMYHNMGGLATYNPSGAAYGYYPEHRNTIKEGTLRFWNVYLRGADPRTLTEGRWFPAAQKTELSTKA